jgi:hypothetical protein
MPLFFVCTVSSTTTLTGNEGWEGSPSIVVPFATLSVSLRVLSPDPERAKKGGLLLIFKIKLD